MRKTKILAFVLTVVMIFSALSVCASAAYAPKTKEEVAAIEDATIRWNADLTVDGSSGQDGNLKNTTVTIYGAGINDKGEVCDLVLTGEANPSIVKVIKNVGRTPGNDPMFDTKAAVFSAYCGTDDSIFFGVDDTFIKNNQEFYVVKSDDSWKVVSKETVGAFKAKAAVNDDNNTISTGRQVLHDIVANIFVTSATFRYTGVTDVKLVVPVFRYNGGNKSFELGTIDDATHALKILGKTVATVSTDAYHNLTAKYYVGCTDAENDLYSVMADVYFDGIMVYSGIACNNSSLSLTRNQTLDKFTGDGAVVGMSYAFLALVVPFYNSDTDAPGTMKDTLYVRSIQEYIVPNANAEGAFNYLNSGNTIEGYDLTLGYNLELNYYMNLLPDVIADDETEVQFKIGEEVVATKKVSEVTPDAKGLYKFTCPVNSIQMASDIKVAVKSGETVYKIFMDGKATDDYTYSVAQYAKALLDGEFSTETKNLVKAMLNYGAYAQKYFAVKNNNDTLDDVLPNVGYEHTPEQLDAAVFTAPTPTGELSGLKATLVLDTDTKIRLYNGESLAAESEGITADKLNDNVTVGGVQISVLYIAGKVPAEKTEFKNLAKALALYSAATEAYITSLAQ